MQLSRASRFVRQLKQQLVMSVHDSSLLRKEELHECSQESRQSRHLVLGKRRVLPWMQQELRTSQVPSKAMQNSNNNSPCPPLPPPPRKPKSFRPTSQSRYSRGRCRSKNMYICKYICEPYSSGSGARFPEISARTTVHHVTVQGLPSTEEIAEKWCSKHHLQARGRPDHQLLRARTTLHSQNPPHASRLLLLLILSLLGCTGIQRSHQHRNCITCGQSMGSASWSRGISFSNGSCTF